MNYNWSEPSGGRKPLLGELPLVVYFIVGLSLSASDHVVTRRCAPDGTIVLLLLKQPFVVF